MILPLGQTAPDFEQDTANGSNRFHAWLGASWGVLFSHPHKIAAIFATEVAAIARLGPEWARRGVKVVYLSADTAEGLADLEETQGCTVDFPMIADCDRSVATLYGLTALAPETQSILLIDPARRVRLVMTYPCGTGTDGDLHEILSAIDRLQLADSQPG